MPKLPVSVTLEADNLLLVSACFGRARSAGASAICWTRSLHRPGWQRTATRFARSSEPWTFHLTIRAWSAPMRSFGRNSRLRSRAPFSFTRTSRSMGDASTRTRPRGCRSRRRPCTRRYASSPGRPARATRPRSSTSSACSPPLKSATPLFTFRWLLCGSHDAGLQGRVNLHRPARSFFEDLFSNPLIRFTLGSGTDLRRRRFARAQRPVRRLDCAAAATWNCHS